MKLVFLPLESNKNNTNTNSHNSTIHSPPVELLDLILTSNFLPLTEYI